MKCLLWLGSSRLGLCCLGLIILLSGCAEQEPEYRRLNGDPLRFSELVGKVVFINYWAVWCKPCREEIPALNTLQKNYSETVVVLGVNFDKPGEEELGIQARELGIEFGVVADDPRNRFGLKPSGVLPETLVVDQQGKLHKVLAGVQTEASLEEVLSELSVKENP